MADCNQCHYCIEKNEITEEFLGRQVSLSNLQMVVCPTCGNKRCPNASNHNLDCTNSNEPGQLGSIYE